MSREVLQTGRRRGRLRRALILDDEPERRTEMRDGLLDHGVVSDEADTVEDAIRKLLTSSYDLAVCDMVLCDPPGAANPALRCYLAVCFAFSPPGPMVVVQASSMRRWAHTGAVLTYWRAEEVADLVYGCTGIPVQDSGDGGCPWAALRRVAAAVPERRDDAIRELLRLPILRELESSDEMGPALAALEDAAGDAGRWESVLAGAWRALFPGAGVGG